VKQSPMPPRTKGLARTARLAPGTGLKRAERKRRPARDTGPSVRVRALVLGRDEHACARCGMSVTDRPRSIHHRVRRSQGGGNSPENLITLCGSGVTGCHGWVHANVAEARAPGWLLLGDDDPLAESVMYAAEYGPAVTFWLTRDGKREADDPREAAA